MRKNPDLVELQGVWGALLVGFGVWASSVGFRV